MKLEMDTNLWMPNKGIFNDDYSEEATHPESSIKNIFKNAFDVRLLNLITSQSHLFFG